MSRQSARGRPQCSSSSAGSASYQGISGATSPVYHLPQDPFDFNFRKKPTPYADPASHNYYNIKHPQPCCPATKDSVADTHSYQYLTNDREERKSYGNLENNFSDDSSFYDYQYKRGPNNYSEYESDFPIAHQYQKTPKKPFQKQDLRYQSSRSSTTPHSIPVLQAQECLRGNLDRVYPEAPLTRPVGEEFQVNSLVRRADRLSERGNTPDSAGISGGSAIVDGCGGHCVVFENVCSYVLQIFFVMGILIGTSLCIAGTVLRRTKSRDLQVLVYIGAMAAMVCTLLLVVQCRVRRSLRKRKRAVRQARAMVIPLGDMRTTCQPLIQTRDERTIIMPVTFQQPRPQEIGTDEQGVPWWRRKDLQTNNRH